MNKIQWATFKSHIARILRDSDPEPIEALSGMVSILWGILFLLPESSLPGIRLWELLLRIMSEDAWGVFFLLMGIFQMLVLFHPQSSLRATMVFLSFLKWTFLALLFFLSYPYNLASQFCGPLGLFCCWAYLRHRRVL